MCIHSDTFSNLIFFSVQVINNASRGNREAVEKALIQLGFQTGYESRVRHVSFFFYLRFIYLCFDLGYRKIISGLSD